MGADAGPAELQVDRAAIGLTGLPPRFAAALHHFFTLFRKCAPGIARDFSGAARIEHRPNGFTQR